MLFSIVLLITGCSYRALYTADDISPDVTITETRNKIEIRPNQPTVTDTGLLFYPGGLVDNHVYNEILSDFVGEAGIAALITKMPGNLAVFDIDAGLSVIEDYPEITTWIIAGHSLGGAMAAAVVYDNPDVFEGLILMDSRPASGNSLADWDGRVLSLYSSIEKIEDVDSTLSLLPPETWLDETETDYPAETSNYTVVHQIDGGSHSYFGTYGPQDGDYEPTITREAFHAEVIEYMIEFFNENGWR